MAAALAAVFALPAFGCSTSSAVVRPDQLRGFLGADRRA